MSPQKKMKKRKELDALIGLSDGRRKSKSSGHRLLRTEPPESGSASGTEPESGSEERSFSGPSGLFTRSPLRCCSLCYPLCVFVVLAACVTACAGLIWMQIALKEDLDSMKEKIHIMESSQKLSSHEILKLSEDLKNKQMKLDELESGDRGLVKLWSNLSEISLKLSALDSAVNHLKTNIKSASDLIALPRTIEELQKSVASIGSTVTSVQHDVSMIQSVVEERRREDQLKANEEKPVNSSCVTLKQDLQHLQEDVKEMNSSLLLHQSWSSEQIQSVRFVLSNLSRWVSALDQSSSEETPPPSVRPLQTLQTAADAAGAGSSAARRPRFLSRRRYRRGPMSSRSTEAESERDEEQRLLKELGSDPDRASLGVSPEEQRLGH
ncbi:EF-hand calcium-binding domain-containing protein 14 [Carassius auratus]|uniref:EF-hand calcium-binding domain-containing protein 14 n=1 Tax=Carassius auratus TaxID=7957 RepID=A0A6P6IYL5_CARAU|nr:EF-hand calcium-binding domain-containing protein 14-like [Carassius auratus]